MASTTALTTPAKPSLIQRFGDKYTIDPGRVVQVVKNTVFRADKQENELSLEEMQAALIVADQYDLNPFTKEIYAFRSRGKLLVVVSVDGWCTLINRQPQLDGIEFEEHFGDDGKIHSTTCKIHRKDRAIPTVVTEYWAECKRDTEPWRQAPARMLRHRALIQCARIAFSISGVLDEEDGERMYDQAGPLIEQQEPDLAEAEVLMQQLGYTEGQKIAARNGHRNNYAALVAFLKKAKQKNARVQRPAVSDVAHAQTRPDAEEQSDGMDPEDGDSQDSLPAPVVTVQSASVGFDF